MSSLFGVDEVETLIACVTTKPVWIAMPSEFLGILDESQQSRNHGLVQTG
jgi:hypothetical protein